MKRLFDVCLFKCVNNITRTVVYEGVIQIKLLFISLSRSISVGLVTKSKSCDLQGITTVFRQKPVEIHRCVIYKNCIKKI